MFNILLLNFTFFFLEQETKKVQVVDFSSKAAKMMLKMGWLPGTALSGIFLLPFPSFHLSSIFHNYFILIFFLFPIEGGLVVPIQPTKNTNRSGLGQITDREFPDSVRDLIMGM